MKNEINGLAAPLAVLARRDVATLALLMSQRGAARCGDPVALARLDDEILVAREAVAASALDASREARDAGCMEGAKQWAEIHGKQFSAAARLRDALDRRRAFRD